MANRIPLERAGTIANGKIYVRAEHDLTENKTETIEHQGLQMLVVPFENVPKDEYAWLGIIRAWGKKGE